MIRNFSGYSVTTSFQDGIAVLKHSDGYLVIDSLGNTIHELNGVWVDGEYRLFSENYPFVDPLWGEGAARYMLYAGTGLSASGFINGLSLVYENVNIPLPSVNSNFGYTNTGVMNYDGELVYPFSTFGSGELYTTREDYPFLYPSSYVGAERTDGFINTTESVPVDDLVGITKGLADANGNQIVPNIYANIGNFSEGFALVSKNSDNNFKTEIGMVLNRTSYSGNDGGGYIDTTGTPLTPQLGDLVPAWNSYNEDKKNFPFYSYTNFQEGIARVSLVQQERNYIDDNSYRVSYSGSLVAIMDGSGRMLTDFIYAYIGQFENGISLAYYDDSLYLIANPLLIENGSITTPEPPTPTTGASDWAVSYIQESYDTGFLDGLEAFWGKYENSITREQFCVLMMNVYKSTGKTVPTGENLFTDTTNTDIISAYHLGIVSGTSPTTFEPSNNTTRQELAVMVKRTAEIFETVDSLSTSTTFLDDNSIDTWAKESVFYAQREGFLSGSGGNILPHDNLSNQEAVTVALRLAQRFS